MFTKRTPKNNEIRSTSKNFNLRYQLLISALLWHIHPFLTSVDSLEIHLESKQTVELKAHLDELTWVHKAVDLTSRRTSFMTQLHPIMSNWLTGLLGVELTNLVLDLINHQIIQFSFESWYVSIHALLMFKPQLMDQINRDVDNE